MCVFCVNPIAYITKEKAQLGMKPTPPMASFSSRGPNIIQPSILRIYIFFYILCQFWNIQSKFPLFFLYSSRDVIVNFAFQPDITAPGVNKIAAY